MNNPATCLIVETHTESATRAGGPAGQTALAAPFNGIGDQFRTDRIQPTRETAVYSTVQIHNMSLPILLHQHCGDTLRWQPGTPDAGHYLCPGGLQHDNILKDGDSLSRKILCDCVISGKVHSPRSVGRPDFGADGRRTSEQALITRTQQLSQTEIRPLLSGLIIEGSLPADDQASAGLYELSDGIQLPAAQNHLIC